MSEYDGTCPHCASRNYRNLSDEDAAAQQVPALSECYDCGRYFVPPGTPPTHDFDGLLCRTKEGIEVVGTLEAFSLHYPPAFDSDYVEGDDCVNALFTPDDPSWDAVWAEVESVLLGCGDMLQKYPYTMESFTTMDGGTRGG